MYTHKHTHTHTNTHRLLLMCFLRVGVRILTMTLCQHLCTKQPCHTHSFAQMVPVTIT